MLSAMPFAPTNGVELFYDETGDQGADPLLLIMGLTAQMTAWDERLCLLLAERGVPRHPLRQPGLRAVHQVRRLSGTRLPRHPRR